MWRTHSSALLRAASALMPTPAFQDAEASSGTRRCTEECVRHARVREDPKLHRGKSRAGGVGEGSQGVSLVERGPADGGVGRGPGVRPTDVRRL